MTAQRAKGRQRASQARTTKPATPGRSRGQATGRDSADQSLAGVSDPVELAKLTLQAICRDEKSPSAARAQSARTLLELAGALRVGGESTRKYASELSPEELDARLASLDVPDTPDTPV